MIFMEKCYQKPILKLCWTVNVGSKWQIVIPKEVRKVLKIQNGDSLTLVMKDDAYLWIVKNENLQDLLTYIELENTNL